MTKTDKPARVLVVRGFAQAAGIGSTKYGQSSAFVSHESTKAADPFETQLYRDDATAIEAKAQTDAETTRAQPWYGTELVWDRCRYMTLHEAEKAVRTLRPIENKLRRMTDEQGSPSSLGHWYARLALALGCTRLIVQDETARATAGHPWRIYARRDWGMAINHVNKLADECRTRIGAKPAAELAA